MRVPISSLNKGSVVAKGYTNKRQSVLEAHLKLLSLMLMEAITAPSTAVCTHVRFTCPIALFAQNTNWLFLGSSSSCLILCIAPVGSAPLCFISRGTCLLLLNHIFHENMGRLGLLPVSWTSGIHPAVLARLLRPPFLTHMKLPYWLIDQLTILTNMVNKPHCHIGLPMSGQTVLIH